MLKRVAKGCARAIGCGLILVWLALAVFWVRSYWRGDCVVLRRAAGFPQSSSRSFVAISAHGGVAIGASNGFWVGQAMNINTWETFSKPDYPGPSMWANVQTWTLTVSTIRQGTATLRKVGAGTLVTTSPATMTAINLQITGNTNLTPVTPGGMTLTAAPGPTSSPAILKGILAQPTVPAGSSQFLFYSAQPGPDEMTRVAIFPYWAVMLAWSVPTTFPVLAIARWSRIRRRTRAGCCKVCGYDLRATPERCPECGTMPTPNPQACDA